MRAAGGCHLCIVTGGVPAPGIGGDIETDDARAPAPGQSVGCRPGPIIVQSHPIDERGIRPQAKEPGPGIAGLGVGCDPTHLDVTEPQPQERRGGDDALVGPGGQTDGVGEGMAGQGAGQSGQGGIGGTGNEAMADSTESEGMTGFRRESCQQVEHCTCRLPRQPRPTLAPLPECPIARWAMNPAKLTAVWKDRHRSVRCAMTDLDMRYPAMADLRKRARRRIPSFAFEYIDSGTGEDRALQCNREALDRIRFLPEILRGPGSIALGTSVLGTDWSLPVGVAPVGMSGLMWPGAERRLARAARAHGIPYCLSSVATVTPEDIMPHAGEQAWFQLYIPAVQDVGNDIIRRVDAAGFQALVLTLDVPAESRRERQRRSGMGYPPKFSLPLLYEIITHPAWSLAMAREGIPHLELLESYIDRGGRPTDRFMHIGRMIRGQPDWQTITQIRQTWDRDLIVKGVQRPEDALRLREAGVDAIWVSNHGGRQFDAGPSSLAQLIAVRTALGPETPILFDSGIASGLDVMRAIACGADMVFMGRGFHYAVAAFGDRGIEHLLHIMRADMTANMAQIGAFQLDDLAARVIPSSLDGLP